MMNSPTDDLQSISLLSNIGLQLTRYCLMVLVTLGLVGNTMNVFVFRHPKLRSNPCSFYLISAAVANLIWISSGLTVRILSTYGLDLSERISVLCKIRIFSVYTFRSLSILFVGLATFDRFLISSSKARYRRLSSLRNSHRLVTGSTIIYCLIFVDLFYCFDVTGTPPQRACTTSTTRSCGLYNEIVRLFALVFIPCFLIIIFGYGTIRNIKKCRLNVSCIRHPQRRIRRTDRQLIQMLLGQIVLLLISYTPHVIQRIYLVSTLDTRIGPLQSRIEMLWGQVTVIFSAIECSFSFYVYVMAGGKLFRETLTILMRRFIFMRD